MSIFYSFGTGALKGIEEQNERRYKMIEDMAPLMQQTYLDQSIIAANSIQKSFVSN